MSDQTLATAQGATAVGGNIAATRRAAREFLVPGHYDAALACCQQIEDIDDRDEEAPQILADAVIAQSREQAGMRMDGQLIRRLKERPPQAAPSWKKPPPGVSGASSPGAGSPLTVIQQLEASLRERPSIADLYLQLAQAYLDKDRDYDAERLLSKGRDATDHDFHVQTMWEEVSMARHARRVETAQEELKSNDSPQARQALADVKKDRDKAELDIFRGRIKRQGADAAAHYGLGIRLHRTDRPRDACEHLEKALADDNVRAPAALALGHCLRQLDDLPSAMRYFRLAADAAIWIDQLACRNEALAEANQLAVQMKLMKLAKRYDPAVLDPHDQPPHHSSDHASPAPPIATGE
jgi:tetratricopeptide (TPR) repeat protein